MSRARSAVKVQGAQNKTRWTLARDNDSSHSPSTPTEVLDYRGEDSGYFKMQAPTNGYHSEQEHPLPRYESFDGSQYSQPIGSRHTSAAGPWKPPESVNGAGPYDGFDFGSHLGSERESQRISVDTRNVRAHGQDAVSAHLLYETALMDSQSFDILAIGEVDALKKEQVRLEAKIEATQRKLALESKVRDAAQNLQRLYSVNTKNRPDTPQSPESPKKGRSSLLGTRRGSGNQASPEALSQADSELASSVKKVDQLHEQMKELLDRRQYVERKLLRHTAAVLAEEANRTVQSSIPGLRNGHHGIGDDDEDGEYHPNDFDGIRDILRGMPAGASNKVQQHEEQLASVQDRLEQMNYQLRNVISEAGQTLGKQPMPETGLDQSDDSSVRLENRFRRLEDNLRALEQQQQDMKTHHGRVQESELQTRNDVEHQMEGLNGQLYTALILASESEPVPGLQLPPQASGQGYQDQLQYMEDSLMTMEQLLQRHGQVLQSARDASAGASKSAAKTAEYETTIAGLWEILQSDTIPSPRPDGYVDPDDEKDRAISPLKESFSLPAFSTRVQHIFDRSQNAKEQHEILRRQIQQQRDLNGKSDAEKDRQIEELQGKHETLNQDHDTLQQEHGALQQELANVMVQHEHARGEVGQAQGELMNTMNEVEELKRAIESKQAQRDELAKQGESLHQRIADLEAEVAGFHDSEDQRALDDGKHEQARQLIETHQAEIERLGNEHSKAQQQVQSHASRIERLTAEHSNAQQQVENHASEIERLNTELATSTERSHGHAAEKENLESEIDRLNTELNTHTTRSQTHATDMENAESEIVRLTTELTMAKAELDSAYGSRAERAKETKNASFEHAAQLERELQEMTSEFQDLTKESIELEREREQLDALIDSLRDRCESLEAQLGDERVRWMGIKSPTNGEPPTPGFGNANGGPREGTSVFVLRQEFKRMMREQRGEGVKLLRVSLLFANFLR